MFVELQNPESLSKEDLDVYLANGWFRMGPAIFTTNFLKFNDITYSSIWLRIDLLSFETSKFQQKMLKINAKFDVEIQPITLTSEQENLFTKYKNGITFDTAPSVKNLLFGQNEKNTVYHTFEINIYDEDKLIAVGFFDLGKHSAEGLACFYDPDYKKHSLGKYLMYLKIDFCKRNGYKFFYTGYFAPGYPMFDYKLDLAKPALQYLDLAADDWFAFETFSPDKVPIDVMETKLRELGDELDKLGVKNYFRYYDFFDADMINSLNGLDLFDFPMFLFCYQADHHKMLPMVVFDVRDQNCHLILCQKEYESIFKEAANEHYNAFLLKITKHLYFGESAQEMAAVIKKHESWLME